MRSVFVQTINEKGVLMNPTIESAVVLATDLHRGQTDKSGTPYILHPLRVMLSDSLTTEEERIVAVLHDVLEDCDITEQELYEAGYNHTVISALIVLTKLEEEQDNYDSFITRIVNSENYIAKKVKLADLKDNSNISRILNPTDKDIRRCEKYKEAIKRIERSL